MLDLPPADVFIVSPWKKSAIEVMTVGQTNNREIGRSYIPENKAILMEIILEDGIFYVLVDADEYIKLD